MIENFLFNYWKRMTLLLNVIYISLICITTLQCTHCVMVYQKLKTTLFPKSGFSSILDLLGMIVHLPFPPLSSFLQKKRKSIYFVPYSALRPEHSST